MAFRPFFKQLFRRMSPIVYTTSSLFVSCSPTEEANPDEKIQWERPDLSKFTYEHMIKRSTLDTVNSVSQALTITYAAIENTSEDYRKSLSQLMSLIKDTLNYTVGDQHWDMIIAVRSEVQKKKRMIDQLVNYMDYVQKMGIAASEASYMANMGNLSATLGQRLDDALTNMNRELKHNEILEMEYNILLEESIKKSNLDKLSKKDDDDDIDAQTILVD